MPRNNESFADLLIKSPWWVSAILGILVFILLHFAPSVFHGHDMVSQTLSKAVSQAAPFVIVPFALLAILSFWFGKKRGQLVDQQTSLQSLRQTSWKDFEFLVAEAFRRQGYTIEYSLGRGADGGVDLVLRKAGRTSLVQCKQWKVLSIGPAVIREMFGLMTAEKADEAIIVTSGRFTPEAQRFADGKPIRLIDGPELLALVQTVQSKTVTAKLKNN